MLRASSTSVAKWFPLYVARRPNTLLRTFTSLPLRVRASSLKRFRITLLTRYTSSISDPSRPDLFYHLVSLPTPGSLTSSSAHAVSFLSQPPPTPYSCSVIGWLPAETAGQGDAEAGLNDFVENRNSFYSVHV